MFINLKKKRKKYLVVLLSKTNDLIDDDDDSDDVWPQCHKNIPTSFECMMIGVMSVTASSDA